MRFLAAKIKGNSLGRDALRRLLRDPFAVLSFLIIVLYVLISLFIYFHLLAPDWQSEIGPTRMAPDLSRGWRFWLGLDIFGRSVTAKVLQGTYTAMYVGLMTSLIAIPIGVVLGAVAGYFGELAQLRRTLDIRYDDVKSGKVKLIPVEEA